MTEEKKPSTDIDLYKSLLKIDNPRIQEADFVRFFLPLFASKDKDLPVNEWLHVAGNSLNPVDVFRGEEFLYTVPPIHGDTQFLSVMGQQNSISEVVATAQRLNDVSPLYGENYLQEALNGRIVEGSPDIQKIKQWNSIFERYGIEQIPLASKGKEEDAVKANKSVDSIVTGHEDF